MSAVLSQERITYLREYLRQKLEVTSDGDLFLEDGTDRIIWVSSGEAEVEIVVITLDPGKVEVQT